MLFLTLLLSHLPQPCYGLRCSQLVQKLVTLISSDIASSIVITEIFQLTSWILVYKLHQSQQLLQYSKTPLNESRYMQQVLPLQLPEPNQYSHLAVHMIRTLFVLNCPPLILCTLQTASHLPRPLQVHHLSHCLAPKWIGRYVRR